MTRLTLPSLMAAIVALESAIVTLGSAGAEMIPIVAIIRLESRSIAYWDRRGFGRDSEDSEGMEVVVRWNKPRIEK